MNVIHSELLQMDYSKHNRFQNSYNNSKIQSVYKIEDFAKGTKNVGELINIINSNKPYDCSYILGVLSI